MILCEAMKKMEANQRVEALYDSEVVEFRMFKNILYWCLPTIGYFSFCPLSIDTLLGLEFSLPAPI